MPGNEHDIPALTNLVPLDSQPHRLTHPALYPVPVYRFPNPPPNDKTKATVVQIVGQCCHYQQGLDKGTSFTPDALKVRVRSQTILSAHWACRHPYTDSLWRPLRRLDFRTLRPPLVLIRARKPCRRFRRRTLGCQVLFGILLPLRSDSQRRIIPPFCQACKLYSSDGAVGRVRLLSHCITVPVCALLAGIPSLAIGPPRAEDPGLGSDAGRNRL